MPQSLVILSPTSFQGLPYLQQKHPNLYNDCTLKRSREEVRRRECVMHVGVSMRKVA